jgi:phage baseplate assembly protein W
MRADLAVIPADEPQKAITASVTRYGSRIRLNHVRNRRWIEGMDLTRSEALQLAEGLKDLAATMKPEA